MKRKKIYERHCAVHRDKRRTFVTLKKKSRRRSALVKTAQAAPPAKY